jgi:hypothetical protein
MVLKNRTLTEQMIHSLAAQDDARQRLATILKKLVGAVLEGGPRR